MNWKSSISSSLSFSVSFCGAIIFNFGVLDEGGISSF